MSGDGWMDSYLAGRLHGDQHRGGTEVASLSVASTTAVSAVVGEADPLLVVGTVMDLLAARGVPMMLDGSIGRAAEAAERLLRCLGVEAVQPWT